MVRRRAMRGFVSSKTVRATILSEDDPQSPAIGQVGALAFLQEGQSIRYLLVTSRRTGRWIFPKGKVEAGERDWEAAAREAMEEGGAVGTGMPAAIGVYESLKIRGETETPLSITLYPVRLSHLLDDWIESNSRQRRLVALSEACELLSQEDMVALCRYFDARLRVG